MPTVLSVTMAVGARLLAKKKAIVSRLVAIEELAGVDVLCTDKTGTLTQNKLTLGDPFAVGTVTVQQVIVSAALASRADDNDTIDLAVLSGLSSDTALDGYTVSTSSPSIRTQAHEATVTSVGNASFKVTKGAPQVILALSADSARSRRTSTKRSSNSLRVVFVRWVWHGPRVTVPGNSSACCLCSIRHARMPSRPSRLRSVWASGSKWSPVTPLRSLKRPPRRWGWASGSWTPRAG